MSDDPDAPKPRFGRYLAVLAFVSMLGFVFLNYRDPWPPIVSPPLVPAPEVPAPPSTNTLSLAPPPAVEADPSTTPEHAAEAEIEDTVPMTSLPLRLNATVVQEDPSRSLARVEDAQLSDAQMLLQGQVFEGRPHVRLITIESDSLLIDNYGTLERLPLEPGGLQFTAESSDDE